MAGEPTIGEPAKPPPRRRPRPAGKVATKGPTMDDKIPCNLKISRRARMTLDLHATMNRGGRLGTASAIVEDLIVNHLRELRVSYHGPEGGQGPAEPAVGPRIAG